MHQVQIGSAAEAASTNNKAFPSLALSFELGLGMAKTKVSRYLGGHSLGLGINV